MDVRVSALTGSGSKAAEAPARDNAQGVYGKAGALRSSRGTAPPWHGMGGHTHSRQAPRGRTPRGKRIGAATSPRGRLSHGRDMTRQWDPPPGPPRQRARAARSSAWRRLSARLVTMEATITTTVTIAMRMVQTALISGVTPRRTCE